MPNTDGKKRPGSGAVAIPYMDHHATTPVDARVLRAMLPYFSEVFGNASSRYHPFAQRAAAAVDDARVRVAELIGAQASEVVFTSGATEATNLALKGFAAATGELVNIVTQATEHSATLDVTEALRQRGAEVRVLDVDVCGGVSADDLRAALESLSRDKNRKTIVSIMLCNNEIGTVQDIPTLCEIAHEHGAIFHCDAAQGLGYLPLDVGRVPIDLLSMSAHKIYGPKGIGALFVRHVHSERGAIVATQHGGGHEGGLRSGTLNVPGIVGFAEAARLMKEDGAREAARLRGLRDRMLQSLMRIDATKLNGDPEHRHPGNLNISFAFVDGAKLLLETCSFVAVSSGAACSQASARPSHVLEAIGVEKSLAAATLRFGLGRGNTEAEVDEIAGKITALISALRDKSDAWQMHKRGKALDW